MIKAVVADDEDAVVSIISRLIAQNNMPIEIVGTAKDGEHALAVIRELQPQLVFLDIQMPLLNGFDVMEGAPGYNYIIVTAFDSFAYAQKALRLGAKDLLLKPVDAEQLTEAVARAIGWNFTDNSTVNAALEHIHLNYAQQVDLTSLAKSLYVTPAYLSRSFKKYVDMSMLTYIHSLRIKTAEELLKSGYSIKTAALEVGYPSLNNFYRYFKEHTGLTPAQFVSRQGKDMGKDPEIT